MTQEEALKVLKDLHETALFSVRNALETFIPELVEGEDERIRKDLIESIKIGKRTGITFTDSAAEKFIAWLEKQKEPKPGTTENNPINPFDTKLFQDGVKEGRRLEREEQKPGEWREEDEAELYNILAFIKNDIPISADTRKEFYYWLKSLRPSWKPSEEQMGEALVARDIDGSLILYIDPDHKMELPSEMFPELTWGGEKNATKVELIIRPL